MEIEIYKKNVIDEIENLKKFATKEELSKLNFPNFNPYWKNSCIYGQMTGDCFNDRANELIILCACMTNSFTYLSEEIQNVSNTLPRNLGDDIDNFTFLEHFISKYKYNNEHIIEYLRDEVDELKLEM